MNKKVVIWTRSDEFWEFDRELFPSDVEVKSIPLIRQETLFTEDQPLPGSAVIISSATTVRTLERDPQFESLNDSLSDHIIYTFGKKTEQALKDHAPASEIERKSKCSNLEGLCKHLASAGDVDAVTMIGAKTPAFDPSVLFEQNGVRFKHIAIYENQSVDGKASLTEAIETTDEALICFASPSAVRSFFQATHKATLEENILSFLVLGQTTQDELQKNGIEAEIISQSSLDLLAKRASDWYHSESKGS